jgi:hypothetical protein
MGGVKGILRKDSSWNGIWCETTGGEGSVCSDDAGYSIWTTAVNLLITYNDTSDEISDRKQSYLRLGTYLQSSPAIEITC